VPLVHSKPHRRALEASARLAAMAIAILALTLTVAAKVAAVDSSPVVVCPGCAVTSLAEAVAEAPAGATIEVRGGLHPGGLVITRDLTLIGVDGPIVDGGGAGSVISVSGASLEIRGFILRNTGGNHDKEDAAIVVDKGRATIEDNRIENALFGVYLKQSPNSVVRGNIVLARQTDIALRGDSIKIWYCNDTVIENNYASDGRDNILWYSDGTVVRGNTFDRGRYGLHLMFSNRSAIETNSLRKNSVGLYIMYGREITVTGNNMSNNHGPSGGGVGLKDVDSISFTGNRIVHNRTGAQVDTSPRERGIENYWVENVFAFNDIGIAFQPSIRHNTFHGNAFIDNIEHISVLGDGQLKDLTWAVDGRGNYWSDYAGFDANGDGIGDRPYEARRLFESLTNDNPTLQLFRFSPAELAVDFAAKAFPAFRPQVKITDPAPLMDPVASPYLPPPDRASGGSRTALGVIGAASAVAAAAGAWALRYPTRARPRLVSRRSQPRWRTA
jgi:nitrous oxidase accessory protein